MRGIVVKWISEPYFDLDIFFDLFKHLLKEGLCLIKTDILVLQLVNCAYCCLVY
jgi:hypothetical protein